MESSARGQTATVTATPRVRVHARSSHRLCVKRARSSLGSVRGNVPSLRGVRLHGSALFRQDSVLLHRLGVFAWCMSRTNIELDDELIAEVMRRYGVRTKREAVDLALGRLVGMPPTREFSKGSRVWAGAVSWTSSGPLSRHESRDICSTRRLGLTICTIGTMCRPSQGR
jgi:Arc/MetJ family transcription regulator